MKETKKKEKVFHIQEFNDFQLMKGNAFAITTEANNYKL